MLLGPLLLALLGAGSAIGVPLVGRSPQNPGTMGADQTGNPPSSSSTSFSNDRDQTMQKYAPWAVAAAGIPLAWTVGRFGQQREDDPRIRDANDFVEYLYFCQGGRWELLNFLREDDRRPILRHLGVNSLTPTVAHKIALECEDEYQDWLNRGKPTPAPTDPQVWIDARNTASRRSRGGNDPPNMAFSLDSAKHLVANAPLAAQQFAPIVQKEAPGAMKHAAAGLASNGRSALQNVKPAKVPVVM